MWDKLIGRTCVVRYIRCGMEEPMDAMAAVALHHAVAVRLHVLLDNVADLAVSLARLHNVDGLLQRLVRHFYQILMLLRHIAHEKCLVQVAVEAAMVHRHIHIAQVAIL